jgi:acyl-CoA thioesterase FadM
MARATLDLPERWDLAVLLEVRVTDLNYGGHLGNDRMLALAQEARAKYLEHLGASELDVYGARIVVADAVVIYRAEVHAGEVLRFEVAAAPAGRVAIDLYYRVRRVRDEAAVAEIKTGVVFLAPASGRPTRVPPPLLERLGWS